MNRNEFMEWLEIEGACFEARNWVTQTPGDVKEIYAACDNQDWLRWLYARLELTAEYQRVAAQAWEEYLRVTAPAWEEYLRVRAQAREEYERMAAWAEYNRVRVPAWMEYERVAAQAREEYKRVCKLPWEIVRVALVQSMSTSKEK